MVLNDLTTENYIFSVWAEIFYPILVTAHTTTSPPWCFYWVMSIKNGFTRNIAQMVANGLSFGTLKIPIFYRCYVSIWADLLHIIY
jgi:hypothetical protein